MRHSIGDVVVFTTLLPFLLFWKSWILRPLIPVYAIVWGFGLYVIFPIFVFCTVLPLLAITEDKK